MCLCCGMLAPLLFRVVYINSNVPTILFCPIVVFFTISEQTNQFSFSGQLKKWQTSLISFFPVFPCPALQSKTSERCWSEMKNFGIAQSCVNCALLSGVGGLLMWLRGSRRKIRCIKDTTKLHTNPIFHSCWNMKLMCFTTMPPQIQGCFLRILCQSRVFC